MRYPVLLLFFFLLPFTSIARDYDINSIAIQAEIQSDGSIRYVEDREYRFDGAYSYAYYTLNLQGFDAIERIRVRKDGRALTSDNSEQPGTFKIQRSDQELRITWYFEADGITEHTFTIQYDIKDALVTGPEYTEWFWKFLSDQLDRTPDTFRARISLPERVAEDQWHVWLRNTPDHIEKRFDGNLLFLEGEGLRRGDEVHARILFPSHVLPDASITDRTLTMDRVLDEEAVYQEALRRAEQNRMLGTGLVIVLIPGSIFILIFFYRKYGRRHKPDQSSRAIRFSPPTETPPALVRVLMLGPLSSEPDKLALGITLFDLSRRGYFRIVEKAGEKKFLSSEQPQYMLEKTGKKPGGDLSTWEKMLLEKVNQRIDDGVSRMDKILKLSTKPGKKWWKKWRKEFKKAIVESEWFDPSGTKVMLFHLAAQLPFLLGSIVAAILAGDPGFLALFVTVGMMFLSITLPRHSQKGSEAHALWSGYRKALKKGPDNSFNQEEIGQHFVYAIALGLTKKQLEKRLGNIQSESPLFIWIVPLGGTTSPAEIASGLSTLASSGTSSFSGVSGAGGAVAGSAGGGSGGGAG